MQHTLMRAPSFTQVRLISRGLLGSTEYRGMQKEQGRAFFLGV